jgi:uncharacterized membrane protein
MMRYDWFGFGGRWPFDGLVVLALIVALAAVVVIIVVVALQRRARPPLDDADAILRGRLARGEISAEEYERIRKVLGLK